jgi:hypothetical protein
LIREVARGGDEYLRCHGLGETGDGVFDRAEFGGERLDGGYDGGHEADVVDAQCAVGRERGGRGRRHKIREDLLRLLSDEAELGRRTFDYQNCCTATSEVMGHVQTHAVQRTLAQREPPFPCLTTDESGSSHPRMSVNLYQKPTVRAGGLSGISMTTKIHTSRCLAQVSRRILVTNNQTVCLSRINAVIASQLTRLHQLDAIFTIFGASDRGKRLILRGRGLRRPL